jgi:hypothetical protein
MKEAEIRERIETAPEPRMVSQKDYDDTIAAANEWVAKNI